MSRKQPSMTYNKSRGLHIGARETDGLGGNARETVNPTTTKVSSREAVLNQAVNAGMGVQPMSKRVRLKETD